MICSLLCHFKVECCENDLKVGKMCCFVILLRMWSHTRDVLERCFAMLARMRNAALYNSVQNFSMDLLLPAAAINFDFLEAPMVVACLLQLLLDDSCISIMKENSWEKCSLAGAPRSYSNLECVEIVTFKGLSVA